MVAAAKEERDGVETLSLFRNARIFTTAPPEETESWLTIMCGASRQGRRGLVRLAGEELYYWSQKNGYEPRIAALTAALSALAVTG